MTPSKHDRTATLVLALLIAAATAALYARTAGLGYVFDDELFIVKNPGLAKGLTWDGVRWAFTATYHANWHPVAWIAHLADRAIFGQEPGPAHLVNAGMHAACAALLFLYLRRTTGALWLCACAAAAFALHPLRVESVAWVTERKDSLSTIFWILTLGAYTRYARRPGAGRYAAVAGLFALGLMSKAMVVTLPAVLLLLDYWPLGRWRPMPRGGVPARRLLLEKIPLLVLSCAAAAAAISSQRAVDAVQTLETHPLGTRAANALVAYATYLVDTVWPAGLAAYYPYSLTGQPLWRILGAALLLLTITTLSLRAARSVPALTTGWFWYVGTLVPVIGIIQVGGQSHADRFTYLPSIGLMIALCWGVDRLTARLPARAAVLATVALATLGTLAAISSRQIGFWQDDVTLFTRAVAVTSRNWLAECNLALSLAERGDLAAATHHYRQALRIRPDDEASHYNLAIALAKLGRTDEAIGEYRTALRIRPEFADAHINLGGLLADRGLRAAAIEHYRAGLRGRPDRPLLHMNLANALSDEGAFDEALVHYAEALRITPGDASIHANRAVTYEQMGKPAAAAGYREALRLDPANPTARQGLLRLGLREQ